MTRSSAVFIVLALLLTFVAQTASAAMFDWRYVKGEGDNLERSAWPYGPIAANHHPGGRYAAVSWTDASGNFWLFGGNASVEYYGSGVVNDLWKFDPTTGIWTFVKGSQVPQQYGVYNDPNPANNRPGARKDAVSWTDSSGNLWLFGGDGYGAAGPGYLNDLWKFDPITENWTFVKGSGSYVSQPSVYNDPNPANNHPGSRYYATTWTDVSDNLWLFGGIGRAASGAMTYLNDLWKFDPTTNNWTFIKGSGDYRDEFSVYNDPNPANNLPGSRSAPESWTDANGDFWLFGGVGVDASSEGLFNDLWKFDPDTNLWTFVKGSGDYNSEYGIYNDPNPANNVPGSRALASTWTDANGDLWLFGGTGFGVSGMDNVLNDLWKFDPDTSNWTFVKGSGDYISEPGVYNNPTPANNYPGSRRHQVAWTDALGNLWMYGGYGQAAGVSPGRLSDLWKFKTTNLNTLVTTATGIGSGTLTATDITCTVTNGIPDGDCSENLAGGTLVELTAAPAAGTLFVEWSGCDSTSGLNNEICHVTLNDDMTVTATFDVSPSNLTASGLPFPYERYDLAWADNATGEIGYRIEYSLNGFGGWSELATAPANATTYSDYSLPCRYFYFRVRADYGGGLFSDYSNTDYAIMSPCDVFPDAPYQYETAWMEAWIETFYFAGLSGGCQQNPLLYCPNRSVTRAEMAVFVLRAIHYPNLPYTPTDPDDHFADVPVATKEWMQPWIEEFYDLGITQGCGINPVVYCPERAVTRAEMAVFILRALEGSDYVPPAASHYFSDVPVTNKEWMETWIDEFKRRGITGGCATNPLRFCPEREVTRAEMAVFILRAFDTLPKP